METVNVNELSSKELEALLASKKAEERAMREAERKEYETDRDNLIVHVMESAKKTSLLLAAFKQQLHKDFNIQEEKLNSYGLMRGNSKGGFALTTNDGKYRVKRVRNTQPQWDERSTKALGLIGEFLRDTVKKKDQKLFEILYSFIQKNDKGDLEYAKVMHLLSHKDKYTDERWEEGLQLIQESYSVQLRGFGYEFYEKNETTGKFDKVEINFTAL